MAPLADLCRPQTLDDLVGQEELLKPDGLLRRMIANDLLSSMILYGPPGTGKTSIAMVIANTTKSNFERINAVAAGKKDIETVCKKAQHTTQKTILFIDEIHRFNKAQQDYLLPFVEQGIITLIGATTENPYFEVNDALVSRSVIFQLKPITNEDITKLLKRALPVLNQKCNSNYKIDESTIKLIAELSNGDARHALTLLETSSVIAENNIITDNAVKQTAQKPHLRYDADGDNHYDTISAFIKSMRGSDPDAVLFYLAKMIESGEDPKFIARRIIIAASEDVSNADPMALSVAINASLAVERIGMPEGRIPLAQAALYIAMAPKSNSAITGIDKALDYIKKHPTNDIPLHLCDCHYKHAKDLGHGLDYKYPHDYPNHWCNQQYLPESVTETFYTNSHIGYENTQAEYQNNLRKSSQNP